jgi:hypothetical protein
MNANDENETFPLDSTEMMNKDQNIEMSSDERKENQSDNDIMDKINEEAEKLPSNIHGVNVYNKYENLSKGGLKSLMKSKNVEIMALSEEQENCKKELSKMIDKLNEAIDKSTSKLLKKDKNPQTMKSLENMLEIRQKELQTSKNQYKIYKQQNDIVNTKANERFSSDK